MFNFDLKYLKLDPGIQKTEEDSKALGSHLPALANRSVDLSTADRRP